MKSTILKFGNWRFRRNGQYWMKYPRFSIEYGQTYIKNTFIQFTLMYMQNFNKLIINTFIYFIVYCSLQPWSIQGCAK
jgi:hypothetical protein